MIPREIIEEVRDRSDIEQIIGSYVTLKRAGSNVKGLCPFHNEKTPSFTVYPDSQSFYCFGCGAGGDVITFTMKYNNLDYTGAIEYLAARAGIDIPLDSKEREKGVSRKRVLEMNLCAARYFRECLFSPEGREALAYLTEKRKLSMATIKHFGLGFAPNDFQSMLKYMYDRGFMKEELVEGYIAAISAKTGNPYSIFRNRIIFPIIDTSGNVIAFGGRVMDDSKPKYLNTNDTPAYKKGRNLFALNYAKDSSDKERLILCEGYMDVIALHSAGFTNAVAGLGTALTSEQARLISKYAKKVILTYDSDEAGQKATERALGLLSEVGLDTRVLVVKGAKDPDEFIKTFGATAFSKLLDESRTRFSYRATSVVSKYNLDNSDEKIAAAREICAIIAATASSVERDICLNEAAEILKLSKEVLSHDVNAMRRKYARDRDAQRAHNAYTSAKGIGDRVNPDYIKNIGGATAEEAIIGLMLGFAEHRDAIADGKVNLSDDDFVTDLGRRCFAEIMRLHKEEGGFDISLLGIGFTVEEIGRMHRMMRARLELTENGRQVLEASVETLKNESERQKAKDKGDRMALLESRRAQLKNKK